MDILQMIFLKHIAKSSYGHFIHPKPLRKNDKIVWCHALLFLSAIVKIKRNFGDSYINLSKLRFNVHILQKLNKKTLSGFTVWFKRN